MLTMNYLLSVTKDCGVVSGDLKSTDQEEVEIHVAAQDRSTKTYTIVNHRVHEPGKRE